MSRAPRVDGPLLRLRRAAGVSRAELALLAGVSVRTVARLDRLLPDVERVHLAELVRVADALGVAPVDLVPGLAYSARRFRNQSTAPLAIVRAERGPAQ